VSDTFSKHLRSTPSWISRAVAAACRAVVSSAAASGGGTHTTAFATITESELSAHCAWLADPAREGRGTPSPGLQASARYIRQRFARAGLDYLPDSKQAWDDIARSPLPAEDARPAAAGSTPPAGTYLRPFQRRLPVLDASSSLELSVGTDPRKEFVLGRDFVPVAGCGGDAAGEIVFVGFAIDAKTEHYDDLGGLNLRGKVALIVEGEPRHPKAFDGPALSPAASLWPKVEKLTRLGVAGVLALRRSPELPERTSTKHEPKSRTEESPASGDDMGFRYEWATFNAVAPDARPKTSVPTLEVTAACAAALLGEDVSALAAKIDKTLHPLHPKHAGRRVVLRSKTRDSEVEVDNVVGLVKGTDEKLSDEYVVVGAHYDHIGVDARGRIGYGADDNASGSAGLLEIAEALAASPPRRSVILCCFAGEEEGLLGSKAFCAHLPVPREKIVAMVNLDMIGRGTASEVAVLGVVQNPTFEKLLERAKALHPTGVREIVMRQGEELFQRSDHYSFHQIGVPALFFFEGVPIEKNPDYHTWRDTVDLLDADKMLRTTRLTFNTVWLLSNDDTRPPRPQG
jgi:Zn-dependent M28 family amino/carboxypeptidase